MDIDILTEWRLTASEASAYIDNETFRLKQQADIQKYEIEQCFEKISEKLIRKKNYLLNFIDYQVDIINQNLQDEQINLDTYIKRIDRFLNNKDRFPTELIQYSSQIKKDLDESDLLRSKIDFPFIVDFEELLDTFNSLIEGHICKQEIMTNKYEIQQYIEKMDKNIRNISLPISNKFMDVSELIQKENMYHLPQNFNNSIQKMFKTWDINTTKPVPKVAKVTKKKPNKSITRINVERKNKIHSNRRSKDHTPDLGHSRTPLNVGKEVSSAFKCCKESINLY